MCEKNWTINNENSNNLIQTLNQPKLKMVSRQPRYYLVFDVETTGLIPKQSPSSSPPLKIDDYPHIIQFSFVLYDIEEHRIVRECDSYIKVAETVVISDFITNLTGITQEMCQRKGRPMIDMINEFYLLYATCDVVVAHNIYFDETMISIEIERNRKQIIETVPQCLCLFNAIHEKIREVEKFCTLRKSVQFCNIPMGDGTRRKKFPKLSELFAKLFPNETLPKNMHNSLMDVMICLKCYLMLEHNREFVV